LQVEHPVTEAITGLDLVEWQLRVASGEPLPLAQDAITMTGHAIEARLNAEDPAKAFLPSVGRIEGVMFPRRTMLRVETGVDAGTDISPYYDSMVAKLIARGPERAVALARLRDALQDTRLFGLKTNLAFLHAVLSRPETEAGTATTALIGAEITTLTESGPDPMAIAIGAWGLLTNKSLQSKRNALTLDGSIAPSQGWTATDAFQLGGQRFLELDVMVDGVLNAVTASWDHKGTTVRAGNAVCDVNPFRKADFTLNSARDAVHVLRNMQHVTVAWPSYDAATADAFAADTMRAPINGRVARLLVAAGDTVEKGQPVAIIEAMKMEHILAAPRAGTIARVAVAEGTQVAQDALVAELEPEEA
jgi:3-methylcrotonyl-CoA carboxylase alpha subunit